MAIVLSLGESQSWFLERERERERERGRERFKNFGKKEHKMGLKISRLTKEQSFSPN